MELLEDRQLLTTVSWINPAGGIWNTASNWRDDVGANRVPAAADDVVIDLTGADYTVTLNVDADCREYPIGLEQRHILSLGAELHSRRAGQLGGWKSEPLRLLLVR